LAGATFAVVEVAAVVAGAFAVVVVGWAAVAVAEPVTGGVAPVNASVES
jgi:hypothetical protein